MPKCPKCNSTKLWAGDTCHTWPSNGTWMSCQGCFSALQYVCEDCHWIYIHGLNKNNPRSEANEKDKPDWLADIKTNQSGDLIKHPDVQWVWDTD